MANQITTVPQSVSSAGHDFNYALWSAGSVVTLTIVPWDSDYRNVVAKSTNIDAYINSQQAKLVVNNMKQMKLNQPIRIDAPFERVSQYNYIRATNPAQPVSGSLPSSYYYFIKSVTYGTPNTTIIEVQLDVWSTFRNNVSFFRGYVERGHIGIANSNQLDQQGRDYLTAAEGMDLGSELAVAQTWRHQIASARGAANTDLPYSIMVTSTVDITAPPGDEKSAKIVTAKGSPLENLPNGGGIYIFRNAGALRQFLTHYADKAWVTQAITSITAIPPFESIGVSTTAITVEGVDANNVYEVNGGSIPNVNVQLTTDWTTALNLPSRYQHLNKFKVFPYSMIEMTTYNGQPLMLKPELMGAKSINANVFYHLNPGSGRVTFVPTGYNKALGANQFSDQYGLLDDGGEWVDFATSIANFPTFSTVNNSYSAYMAANRNSIAFQQSSAMWDQNKALAGAATAANNSLSQMTYTADMNNADIRRLNTGKDIATETNMFNSMAGVAGSLSPGGMGTAAGAMSTVMNAGQAFAGGLIRQNEINKNYSMNSAYAMQAYNASMDNQGYQRDNNLQYAKMAAKGDYANAIAGVQAKTQDAKMLQPTTSGQLGGESFNLAKIGWALTAKLKVVTGAAQRELGEYWLRYGYAVNRFMMVPNQDMLVCNKFSYWKMQEVGVRANGCPEEYRMVIRGIFEKGVTVWKNPEDIDIIDPATNTPLEGISY